MTKRQKSRTFHQFDLKRLQRELIARVSRQLRTDGNASQFGMLYLSRASEPSERSLGMYEPTLCVVAQGRREMQVGGKRYVHDPSTYLVGSVPMPVTVRVIDATPDRPYMCVGIPLDAAIVGSVLVQAELPAVASERPQKAIDVSAVDTDLLDPVVRLVRLLDTPRDAPALGPLILREIVYRLLVGAQGARLRQIAPLGGPTYQIAKAIEWLRRSLDQPMRVEALSKRAGMSASGFHHYFRIVTGMSPLQYQKRLRLEEARRLLLAEGIDAANAGFRVGYNDASQFTREYRRLFGAPPMRDVATMRARASGA
jgi:AraC-like DNA-binding protein